MQRTHIRHVSPLFAGLLAVAALAFVLPGAERSDAGSPGVAEPIGAFLDGRLPATTPVPPDTNAPFELVDAFPNLPSFRDPIHLLQRPGTNTLWLMELRGRIYAFDRNPNVSTRTQVLDLGPNVLDQHDSGAMSFAFHPNFDVTGAQGEGELFIAYRWAPEYRNRDQAYVRLSRFQMNGNGTTVNRSSEEVLIQQYDDHNWHNGCAILFGPDGFLYMTVGDEGAANDSYDSAQEIDVGLFSGVLRIDVDRDAARSHPIRRQPVPNTQPPSGWPSTYSQGYYIPNDNPWLDASGDILEEFWCLGLRSPHRMFMDPVTNEMWIGDVGQGNREEVSIVRRAANFEWPWMEGARVNGTKPALTFGVDTPPEYDYTSEIGNCVIGGHVYRGTRFPDLYGKYIFGDNASNYVYALPRGATVPDTLVRSPLPSRQTNGLTSINVDADGELYILALDGRQTSGARIRTLSRGGNSGPQPPSLLSETGVFSDLATLTPATGVRPYEINTPLWSDGASKLRYIAVPNDGTHDTAAEQVGFSATGNWTFPVGTVLVKHFEFPGDRLETRLLVHGSDGVWYGLTYRWRDDESDADLLPGSLQETVQHDGETFTWHYPSRQECLSCHTTSAGNVLGVRTRQLNRDCPDPTTNTTVNQLLAWDDAGIFDDAFDRSQVALYLRSRSIDDTSATWERRARSYLDSNCSHCHQPGEVRTQWDGRLSSPPLAQRTLDEDPGDTLGIANARVIAPGDRLRSVLYERVNTLDGCCAMPTLAKSRIDTEAVAVLRQWIESMEVAHASSRNLTDEQVDALVATPDFDAPLVTLTSPSESAATPIEFRLSSSEPLNGLDLLDFVVLNGTPDDLRQDGDQWVLSVLPTAVGPVEVTLPSDRAWDGVVNANHTSNTATTNYTGEPPPPPPPPVEPPGPVNPSFWMVFNEGAGTTSAGNGGNAASGTLHGGATWVSGQYGGGVHLDGTGWVEVPYTDALRITQQITLATWVNAERFRDWDGVITSGGAQSPWAMQLWSDGAIRFTANWAGPTGGQGEGSWNSNGHLSLNTWHHIAVTYDGATLRFYIDGQRDTREIPVTLTFGQGQDRFVLGAGLPGFDEFFQGAMDDARVYDRALSDEEVESLTAAGAPPPPDTTRPSVALATAETTVSGPYVVDVGFDEDVTGLVAADFVVENGTATTLTGSGAAYGLLVTPLADGLVRVTLPADAASDAAGNGSLASAPLDVTYVAADTTQPTVALSTPTNAVDAAFNVDVVFSEDVSGLLAGDFVVTNGTAGLLTGTNSVYVLQVVPTSEGVVSVTLPADAAADAAGNGNVASNVLQVSYTPPPVPDTDPPTVTLSTASNPVSGAFAVDVVFNEDVTGLTASDFVLENGTAGALSGANGVYTLPVTPVAEGLVRITLPANAAADAAGNGNTASTPLEVTYAPLPPPDTERPTVALSTASPTVEGAFDVDVTFSESVTGLSTADFDVDNGLANALSGSGGAYVLRVVPTVEGTVRIALPADAAADGAGNGNVASAPLDVTYAIVPPPGPDTEPDYPYDAAFWLRFNEGSGLFTAPYGQNGHSGRLTGATWTSGQHGGAVRLDGDDEVQVSCTSAIDFANTLSVAAWVRADRLRDWDAIATRGGFQSPWGFTQGPDGRLRFTANWGNPTGGSGEGSWTSTLRITQGQWHHVAVTYDGSTLRFYVDGQEDPAQPFVALTFGIGEERFVLGAGLPVTDEYFLGALDDVRAFDRALSAAELRVMAGIDAPPAGEPPAPTPLEVKVNFQPTSGSTPAGYLVDAGTNYGKHATRWYGWSFNLSHAVKRRNAVADVRLDTIITAQNATWEIELPNGTYDVTVASGDPTVATTATVTAEGVTVWTNAAIGAGASRVKTVTVQITDGRLTLATGAAMTHLAYVEIAAAQ